MDTVSFISQSISQVNLRLLATCEGLSQQQVLWRPTPYANNVGFILWHMARAEDYLIGRLRKGTPSLWASEGWYQRFQQPIDAPDPGDKMGLQSLAIPDLDVLIGYTKAVHRQTNLFLPTLAPEELDGSPDPARLADFGLYTAAFIFKNIADYNFGAFPGEEFGLHSTLASGSTAN